jgi:hypothetical protein
MEPDSTPALDRLALLLRKSGATPVVREGRVVPSVVYDFHYRVAVTACAFTRHARAHPGMPSMISMRSDKLKFLQFIAVRPWLVTSVREWSQAKGDAQRSMLTSDRLRKGFIGDTMHDRVVDYLVAAGVLARLANGTHLTAGGFADSLQRLTADIANKELFVSERTALDELANITITNDMLEGL